MSQDPVGFVASNPMSLYVNNNPYKDVGPNGAFFSEALSNLGDNIGYVARGFLSFADDMLPGKDTVQTIDYFSNGHYLAGINATAGAAMSFIPGAAYLKPWSKGLAGAVTKKPVHRSLIVCYNESP